MKKYTKKGKIPLFLKLSPLCIGLPISVLALQFDSIIGAIISITISIVAVLSLFFHYLVETDKKVTIYYGFIPISLKNLNGLDIVRTEWNSYEVLLYMNGKKNLFFFTGRLYNPTEESEDIEPEDDDVDYQALFKSLEKSSIHFSITEEPTNSYLGGLPKVPKDFVWPRYTNIQDYVVDIQDRPLLFIMDVDLSEIAHIETPLPKEGHLCVFYDQTSLPWGDEGEEKGLRIFYFNEETTLATPPLDLETVLEKRNIAFFEKLEVPTDEEYETTHSKFKHYFENHEKSPYYNSEYDYNTKLFGYEDSIQGFSRYGLNENKILLLQIDSYKDSDELLFGDNGKIYIYITQEDLDNLNFDNISYTLQCY